MRRRNVDVAFDWMRRQPHRAYHYRDEVWAALAALHPDEFAVTDDRKTPWYSLHRDMTQDARFVRSDQGMFEIADAVVPELSTPAEVAAVPEVQDSRVWIFQANPKFYRILEALQSRVNALSTDFVNRDDPFQRAKIAEDRQKALSEMSASRARSTS